MNSETKFYIIISIMLGLFVVLMIGNSFADKYIHCPNRGEILEMPTKYYWSYGCFVQMDNKQWIKYDKYQGIKIDN